MTKKPNTGMQHRDEQECVEARDLIIAKRPRRSDLDIFQDTPILLLQLAHRARLSSSFVAHTSKGRVRHRGRPSQASVGIQHRDVEGTTYDNNEK